MALNFTKIKMLAFSTPALIAILPFLGACFYIFRFSISADKGEIEGSSIQPYLDLNNPFFWRSAWVTLKLATIGTMIVMVLAIPLAFLLTTSKNVIFRRILTVTILLPMILNLLIQSYGWIILLGPTGVLNTVLRELGIISRPLFLLF